MRRHRHAADRERTVLAIDGLLAEDEAPGDAIELEVVAVEPRGDRRSERTKGMAE